jgi:hypothetical protein
MSYKITEGGKGGKLIDIDMLVGFLGKSFRHGLFVHVFFVVLLLLNSPYRETPKKVLKKIQKNQY